MREMKQSKKRYRYIDVVRGVAIIGMLIHHFMYDLYKFDYLSAEVLFNRHFVSFLTFGAGVFVFISGVCTSFSSNNYKRGGIILGVAYLFQIFTYFFMSDSYIAFGILHLLGWCNILAEVLKSAYSRVRNKKITIGVLLLISVIVGYGIEHLNPIEISWLYPFGFYDNSFYSADYFPLLPWIFVFMSGIVYGQYQLKCESIRWLDRVRCKPIEFIGRNTLWIYILHQPIFYLLFYAFGMI